MAEDWAANVKKYVPDANDGIIAGIVRYCGIALTKRDSSLVSMGDPKETARVREGFLKKKLGLTHSDADLDASIADVGTRMKGENFKNRVTVYYLLAEKHGMLGSFMKAASTKAASTKAAGTGAGTAAAAGGAAALAGAGIAAAATRAPAAATRAPAPAPVPAPIAAAPIAPPPTPVAPPPAPVAAPPPSVAAPAAAAPLAAAGMGAAATGTAALGSAAMAGAVHGADRTGDPVPTTYDREPRVADTGAGPIAGTGTDDTGGRGWLPWLLLGLGILALILLLSRCNNDADDVTPVATDTAVATAMETPTGTAAPAATTPAAVPTGAGITSEMRGDKPVLITYFDTGKAAVVPAFGPATTPLKDYLAAHAGSSLAVSGFTDPTGNAAANAALSKNRAAAVKAALVAAGVTDAAIAMVKPADSSDASGSNANGRRVEVTVN